ncbi:MAG: response regulator [Brasilonema octagenarum HA4186-MV1]|jgi:DNA-binding response OmpR family regulator|uniref:DNA-binding response regulator n=1 Tax=Brasilonema octagenarum UFV-OR1 TaxID=417115 RepID=A0ABX1MB77_9CYAN|nr:two-component system response regulator RppA [Brasilonema octagenarum]MBW4629973.1 response regulator [Brasilonema octagenarum HA4186-MV1]NMF64756.1 DNA-binding response regulator [Brasilonema octagenarum UFV-OR1]
MKILLVEDEPDLGASIARKLSKEKYIVDWVLDGTEAWICLENEWTQYTLAIFDWLLPGISGLELCKRLRLRGNPLPVLILTAKDSMADKVAGLDAGADDYLVKPFGMAELLARLRALQRRSPQFQPQQLQVGSFILDYGSGTVCYQHPNGDSQVISLTKKEFHLLEYFMKHPNQILSREQILSHLYTLNAERISNVVAAQIRLLRRKLSEHGCDGFIETVPSMGYRFNSSDAN